MNQKNSKEQIHHCHGENEYKQTKFKRTEKYYGEFFKNRTEEFQSQTKSDENTKKLKFNTKKAPNAQKKLFPLL